tara:strand:+ start:131 stop:628 length:498 start_codon:yes stop_codon:yes gene_type:complete
VSIYGIALFVILHLLTVPLAVIYTNLLEWGLHKYVLHGLGKHKNSKWASHWHTHHKKSRKNNNFDEDYLKNILNHSSRQEIIGLMFLSILHVILFFVIPLFYITLLICSARYYYLHRKAHLDISWCKEKLPWHYDHHMGKNQDANWGVTTDWVDKILKTRIKYFK